MYPTLAQCGPLSLSTYGVVLALAFLVAVGLASFVAARAPQGRFPLIGPQLVDLACWTMVGGVVGGRVLFVAFNWPIYARQPLEIVAIWHGGLVWYGGFAGGVVAGLLYVKRHHIGFLRAADQVMPFVALAHAIGRLGCFANGCCYGIPTAAWFGVQFPGHPQPVVPTQLVESIGLVALYVTLRILQARPVGNRPGSVLGVYLIGYGAIRWLVEYWRADQPIVWPGILLHQLFSALVCAMGAILLARAVRWRGPTA